MANGKQTTRPGERDPMEAPYVGDNPKKPSEAQAGGNEGRKPDDAASNRIKDPSDWVTGDEPMTGAQKSYLKTLSEEVHDPDAFDPGLHKAEASERIDDLKKKRDGG
jgi:hypothetical protein